MIHFLMTDIIMIQCIHAKVNYIMSTENNTGSLLLAQHLSYVLSNTECLLSRILKIEDNGMVTLLTSGL